MLFVFLLSFLLREIDMQGISSYISFVIRMYMYILA